MLRAEEEPAEAANGSRTIGAGAAILLAHRANSDLKGKGPLRVLVDNIPAESTLYAAGNCHTHLGFLPSLLSRMASPPTSRKAQRRVTEGVGCGRVADFAGWLRGAGEKLP